MTTATRNRAALGALAALAGLAYAPGARAGGIYLPGYGPQAQARAGAFVARADDPSALFHNPAGFAKVTGSAVQIGSNFINMGLSYKRAGGYEPTGEDEEPAYVGEPYPEVSDVSKPAIGVGGFQAVPVIAVATDLGYPDSPLRVAFGVIAPNGYPDRQFTPDYEFEEEGVAPPPQRYDIMEQRATLAGPSLAASYRITDDLDVGARLTWGIGSIEATSYLWGVRNYGESVHKDGLFSAEAEDNFVPMFGAGALYRPTPSWELGVSYASAAHIEAKGTGVALLGEELGLGGEQEFIAPVTENPACAPGGRVDALKACLSFDLPRVASVGGRWIFRDGGEERADVELDVRWENWSAGRASEYEVVVDGKSGLTDIPLEPQVLRHGFRDVLSVRLGGSYTFPIAGSDKLIVRSGAAYDTAAAPENFTRLDVDGAARATLGSGVAYETPVYRFDVGVGGVLEPDRQVRECQTGTDSPSCTGSDAAPRVDERDHPDPLQPLRDPANQFQSPFNAGTYSSGYFIMSFGFTTWF